MFHFGTNVVIYPQKMCNNVAKKYEPVIWWSGIFTQGVENYRFFLINDKTMCFWQSLLPSQIFRQTNECVLYFTALAQEKKEAEFRHSIEAGTKLKHVETREIKGIERKWGASRDSPHKLRKN